MVVIWTNANLDFIRTLVLVPGKLVCVAGGISVGVLYCFGGGAARRVGKSQFGVSRLASRGGSPRKYPGHKNPASNAGYR